LDTKHGLQGLTKVAAVWLCSDAVAFGGNFSKPDGRPAAGGDHLWELVFHRDEGAAEVDGDRRVEGLDVDIGRWRRPVACGSRVCSSRTVRAISALAV
jgi:hypothetical protein